MNRDSEPYRKHWNNVERVQNETKGMEEKKIRFFFVFFSFIPFSNHSINIQKEQQQRALKVLCKLSCVCFHFAHTNKIK